jgi:prophage regulatory protein
MIQSEACNISSTGRILRWPELQHKVGYSRSNVYRLIDQGHFPPPIKLGARAVGWLESEVNAWIQDRIDLTRQTGE